MCREGDVAYSFSEGAFLGTRYVRRPLAGVSLLFVAGIFCGMVYVPPIEYVMGLALLCLTFSLFSYRYTLSHVFICMTVVLLGTMTSLLEEDGACSSSLSRVVSQQRVYLAVDGVVMDDPVYTASEYNHSCKLLLRLEGVRIVSDWQRSVGVLRVNIQNTQPDRFEFGQRWQMEGLLKKTHARGFFYGDGVLYTDDRHCVRGVDSVLNTYSLRRLCYRARSACAQLLSLGVGEEVLTTRLLKALMLGYRQDLPYELKEMFSTTGTFHIFAISGLHVGIVTVLLIGALKILGVTRRHWVLWLVPLLVLYTLGTGARASAVRACIMALVFWSAALSLRRPDTLSALGVAAMIILLSSPSQLRQPGFVMSFVVVGGIVVLYPIFSRRIREWFHVDPFRITRENVFMRAWRRLVLFVADIFCVSLAAWLVSVPITAYCFHVFCPVSLLGNVLIVPGAFLVVLTGCLSLVTGFVFPGLAEVFNFANAVFISFLLRVVELMRMVPGGHYYVKSPSLWLVACWYAGLLALLLLRGRRRVYAWLLVGVMVSIGVWHYYFDQTMTVDILNVGQGNAAFVNMPHTRHDMLIDTGSAFQSQNVLNHLRREGVDRLGVLVLSHPDRDHIGAAMAIMAAVPVDKIWMPSLEQYGPSVRQGRDWKIYCEVISYAQAHGIPIHHCGAGCRSFIAGAQVDVFWPQTNVVYDSANDGSLVLRVAREGGAVLFMGGGRRRVENKLRMQARDYAAPVLVVGNHGAKGVCSMEWLDRIRPESAVISAGFYNAYGDPDADVLKRLHQFRVDVWRTDCDGPMRMEWVSPDRGYYRIHGVPK